MSRKVKDAYYTIAVIAALLMGSCVYLTLTMPFEGGSQIRLIFSIVLCLQMVFDFIVFLFYFFKGNEAKE